ncbi:MAG: ubiquinol-cytochrome c reductase iron-sulfur subunit [Anaerolineae bacterium]
MNDNQKRQKGLNRREFLGLAWAVSLIGLFGQAGLGLFHFFKPRLEAGAFGGKVSAGQVDEFQPGTVNHVQKGRFYISRLEDGGLLALWHRCTHLGCTVPWRENQGIFLCPCHSSAFNTAGEVISGPAPRPMDIFPIEIVDGEVVVNTGQVIERQAFDASQVFHQS